MGNVFNINQRELARIHYVFSYVKKIRILVEKRLENDSNCFRVRDRRLFFPYIFSENALKCCFFIVEV